LLFLSSCEWLSEILNEFETIEHRYANWQAILDTESNAQDGLPHLLHPTLNGGVSLESYIFDVINLYDIDNNSVWGRFSYADNFFTHFDLDIEPFNRYNYIDVNVWAGRRMQRVGFDENKIDFYFFDRPFTYLVNTEENVIYFLSFRLRAR